jgi:hypothetical protein
MPTTHFYTLLIPEPTLIGNFSTPVRYEFTEKNVFEGAFLFELLKFCPDCPVPASLIIVYVVSRTTLIS